MKFHSDIVCSQTINSDNQTKLIPARKLPYKRKASHIFTNNQLKPRGLSNAPMHSST